MHALRTKTFLISSVVTLAFGPVAIALASTTPTNDIPFTPVYWPTVYSQTTSTSVITSGVIQNTNHFETADGPLQANVLSVDLRNPNVKMGVVLANNQVYSKDETVSSMATRTGAIGGVNGDFFELGASGRPENLCISNGTVLQSQLPGGYAVIGVTNDGHITIGPETFDGSVTVTSSTYGTTNSSANMTVVPPGPNSGSTRSTRNASASQTVTTSTYGTLPLSSFPLIAVNRPGQEKNGGLALITPAMGSLVYVKGDTAAYLTPIAGTSTTFQVTSVQSGAKAISPLTNEDVLVAGGGAAATWMNTHMVSGDIVTLQESVSPDNNLVQAVGSGYQLLKNGLWYADPKALGTFAVNQHNPLTAVGVTKDGRHAFMVVFDGRYPTTPSIGLTYHQMAAYLQHLGAWNAAMLDGGGSSEIVAREPGNQTVSVLNSPSDGHERPVADGLFVYSTEPTPGPASQVVLSNGAPIRMMVGASTRIQRYALDNMGNPAAGSIMMSVSPSTLASVKGNQITAQQSGTGKLIATASNGISSAVPLTVVTQPASIQVTPSLVNTVPGQTTRFTATALDANGQTILLPANALQWTTSKGIGTISSTGLFQATALVPSTQHGTVDVAVAGVNGVATVQVGYAAEPLDAMTVVSDWNLSSQADGKLSRNHYQVAQKGDKASLQITYDYPAGRGSAQVVFWPKNQMTLTHDGAGDAPMGVGFWVKGDNSNLDMAVSVTAADGQRETLYPGKVNFMGWRFITVPFPAGMGSSVTLNFLDFLVMNPAQELKGRLFISDLQALYPVSSATGAVLPSWFHQVQTPKQFTGTGLTMVATGGARIRGTSPMDPGAIAMTNLAEDLRVYYPTQRLRSSLSIQLLGDMVSTGLPADYQGLSGLEKNLGAPVHNAVGKGEIGTYTEANQFRKSLGRTHYTYMSSGARVIVLDDAHDGIAASDADQSPAEEQFAWLSRTLAATHAKTVLIVANEPAFSGTPGDDTALMNPLDAKILEQVAQNYQLTNPNSHAVLLFEGASAFSVRQMNTSGQEVSGGGVLNLYVPPLCTSNRHVNTGAAAVLLHVAKDGSLQWTRLPIHGVSEGTKSGK